MSLDTVDLLEAAEDRIVVLEGRLDLVMRMAGHADGLGDDRYCRPSCIQDDDGRWECGVYCGCPAMHPEGHA